MTGDGRIEIGLSARAAFRVFALADPPRLVIDIPGFRWEIPSIPSLPSAASVRGDLVRALRPGAPRRGDARLVVDLRSPAKAARAFTERTSSGARLVLELERVDEAAFAASAGWPDGARRGREAPDRATGDRLIVVDPGHGGVDPGALSGGLREKDLVLDYARALAAALSAEPGLSGRLTRDGDAFLTLRERVAIARRTGAAAFLSIHADALESGDAAGASVYTLSDRASSREAAALARSHNRAEAVAGAPLVGEEDDVARVLIDLARRRTGARSRALAGRVAAALGDVAPVLAGRAHQSAGFRVLTAPDAPSVLIELGFMSSAADRERLTSPEGRDALVAALVRAVVAWVADDG